MIPNILTPDTTNFVIRLTPTQWITDDNPVNAPSYYRFRFDEW